MGYTTWFTGSFQFNKPVTDGLKEYINEFSSIRHMKRDVEKIKEIYHDWEKKCFLKNLGIDGEFFIGGNDDYGRVDKSVLDHNRPGGSCPELWCQWIIDENGDLVWDEGEKFYGYVEWLEYLIDNFFQPCGYILNGEVNFQGEDDDDFGIIKVTDNKVEVSYGMRIMSIGDIDTNDLIAELQNRGYTVQN